MDSQRSSAPARGSLTPRQNEIYEFIRGCIQQRNTPPTITEIGQRFGIRSTNGVNDLLIALEKKGYIIRLRGTARGIALPDNAPAQATGTKGGKKIPIVGEGDSSNPFSIFMNPHGTLLPDPAIFPTVNSFAAIVADDAMDGEGIFKGDYVIVQQGREIDEGMLVFSLVGEQQLVRRLQGSGGARYLTAANRYYKRLPAPEESPEVAIIGEVVGVIRSLRKREE
jgi:repressor LexA